MKRVILFLLILLPLSAFAQSYVFPPQLKRVEPKSGLSDVKLSVVFQDNRTFERKLNERCTKDELYAIFVDYLGQAFPNAQVTLIPEDRYNEDPQSGTILLKLNLLKFESTLLSTVYIASVRIEAKIIDNSGDIQSVYEEKIKIEGRQMNTLGHTSGHIGLNNSFKKAFNKLTDFLENSLTN